MNESLTEILKRRLASNNAPLAAMPATIAEMVVETLLTRAHRGDVQAIELIWERVDPIPTELNYPTALAPMIPPTDAASGYGDFLQAYVDRNRDAATWNALDDSAHRSDMLDLGAGI